MHIINMYKTGQGEAREYPLTLANVHKNKGLHEYVFLWGGLNVSRACVCVWPELLFWFAT